MRHQTRAGFCTLRSADRCRNNWVHLTAIQHGMNQLKVDFVDSHRETQQMLEVMNQYIDSLCRWLKTVVVFFLLSLGGLFYMIFRPVRIQESPVMRKRKAPETRPVEDEIVRWQNSEPANGPGRTPLCQVSSEIPPFVSFE